MSKPEIGAGDVQITLHSGEEIVLKPSLACCYTISDYPGGAKAVMDKLDSLDLRTYAMVVRAGLNVGASAVKSLDQDLYETGLLALRDNLKVFVGIVFNGGRPLVAVEAEPEAEAEGERPQKAGD